MMDFFTIAIKPGKGRSVTIAPKFITTSRNDLMIRGSDFYAAYDETSKLWLTDEIEVVKRIDAELAAATEKYKAEHPYDEVETLYLWDSDSGSIDKWHRLCQKQARDYFRPLDETLIFANQKIKKSDYASRVLPYNLEAGDISAWDELISTLYNEDERHKIEWAIGAVVSGDSKKIQKFLVFYGASGTGKSTIMNIIQMLFPGYYATFDSKAMSSRNNSFALESLQTTIDETDDGSLKMGKSNPLVAIQHDGDLSHIEDNTLLNSLVSHETMPINTKHKSIYPGRFKCFLFMGSNKPVKITDAKSGILRRLIDVTPSGNTLPYKRYKELMKEVEFELGAIAQHCLEVYQSNPEIYDSYVPTSMMSTTNDFYNFIEDNCETFEKEDCITLNAAWEMYKNYCEEAKVPYPFSMRMFKDELQNYFKERLDRGYLPDGTRVRCLYKGFIFDKFAERKGSSNEIILTENKPEEKWVFKEQSSIFDKEFGDCLAQYANEDETPTRKWENVKTTLKLLTTSLLHYVKFSGEQSLHHIVIDFDIPDENGNKSFEKNFAAIQDWPLTYAELSKSGQGIHLHYWYSGDVSKLNKIYGEHIEIKVFNGNSSLRRRLTKCTNYPIATISSGLPLAKEKKVINFDTVKDEKALANTIKKVLRKETQLTATKPCVDFIFKLLEDAYNSGLKYDLTPMYGAVLAFAANSTHHSEYCIDLVGRMHFASDEPNENDETDADGEIWFYDIEVYPNLLLICASQDMENWIDLINPSPAQIEAFLRPNGKKRKLVGFNCRRYDNHIVYAAMMGYTNAQLFNLSQKIVGGSQNCFFGEAYNLSYTDIYDFASAGNKMSLKKLEILMGIHHQECPYKWDRPVPKDKWPDIIDYCHNDVRATGKAFVYLEADWIARQMLAKMAKMTVNDTTNSLTKRIVFGREKHPQGEFCYRKLSEPVFKLDDDVAAFLKEACPEMMSVRHGAAHSLLPYFEGYKFDAGVSTYRGEIVGEGGYVYAEPGMYFNVALLDIASMHPHSAIAECLFGPKYTRILRELILARVYIKHQDWEHADAMMNGLFKPFTQMVKDGLTTSKALATALKTAINAVYGLTSAKFDNQFKDRRNIDNIVAKRGALFMIDLKHEVQKRGFTVAHIKTDSIKIPNATPEIIKFVMDYGKLHGYTFEHEATYEKMCLVNDAVYIAKYADGKHMFEFSNGHKIDTEWTATGTQFAVPYVFKSLFAKAPIEFDDLCSTFSATTSLYLDYNEGKPDVSKWEQIEEVRAKQARGTKLTKKEQSILDEFADLDTEALINQVLEGHSYTFIGKVGQFCPILPGNGGGILYREDTKNGKYAAAAGTTGYRWMETEEVHKRFMEDRIDVSYYRELANKAIDEISKYGDYNAFVA